jgi:hypothetical protein
VQAEIFKKQKSAKFIKVLHDKNNNVTSPLVYQASASKRKLSGLLHVPFSDDSPDE